jgi:hypothetical protein
LAGNLYIIFFKNLFLKVSGSSGSSGSSGTLKENKMDQRERDKLLDWSDGEGLTVSPDATPLDFLCAIYRDAQQPMYRRQRAAAEAAQYMHPKLTATAIVGGGDFAQQLERAVLRSAKIIDVKPIELEAKPVAKPVVETKPPLPHVHDRRYRRI